MAAPASTNALNPVTLFGTQSDATITPMVVDANGGIISVGNRGSASCTFTPAASSHTALDSVGGAQTMTFTGASGRLIHLTGYTLSLATTTPITTVYTAFIFSSTPTVIADDAAFVIAAADGAKLAGGPVAIAQPVDYTSTWQLASGLIASQPIQLVTETATVYLQNTSTVTTEAVAFKLTLYYTL